MIAVILGSQHLSTIMKMTNLKEESHPSKTALAFEEKPASFRDPARISTLPPKIPSTRTSRAFTFLFPMHLAPVPLIQSARYW